MDGNSQATIIRINRQKKETKNSYLEISLASNQKEKKIETWKIWLLSMQLAIMLFLRFFQKNK